MRIRRNALSCRLTIWSLLAGSCLAPATAQLLGPEFQVNTYTTGYQRTAAVAADGLGNFVVVWASQGDGSFEGVFGQRFNSAGSPIGNEFQVNTYTTNSQYRPAVAADATGNFVVVWSAVGGQDGSNDGVFGQRFNSAGSPAGSEFRVNTYTPGRQRFPAVTADALGNFIVVWDSEGQDGSSYGVFGQRFNSAGGTLGSEFQVNTHTTDLQVRSAVAADASGNFVAVWVSNNQDGSYSGVFGQRFDTAGNAVGGELQVNTFTTSFQYSPAVAVDGSGNFVVVWVGEDGSGGGITGQRFDSSGSPAGGEFTVNSYTPDYQGNPAVAVDALGNFVVVWELDLPDGSDAGVSGQRFNSLGTPVRGEFQVHTYSAYYQRDAAVAVGASGNFVVVWQRGDKDGSDDVFGRRISSWIFIDGFELGEACDWSAAVGGGCP